ncbi:MAG: phytochelatin synthase family protein, partial [Cyanobacteriota bacterium]
DHGLVVRRFHGDQLSLEQFRQLLREGLRDRRDRLVVNYLRSGIAQKGSGHISPIAAYDSRSDRVLILDVARYRYPAVWVKAEALWRAMGEIDKDSGQSRGLLILSWNQTN